MADVPRLVHCYRDLARAGCATSSTSPTSTPRGKAAIFQAGTLYLDGRSCDLCVRVADPAAHAPLALGSNLFIAYCDCAAPAPPA